MTPRRPWPLPALLALLTPFVTLPARDATAEVLPSVLNAQFRPAPSGSGPRQPLPPLRQAANPARHLAKTSADSCTPHSWRWGDDQSAVLAENGQNQIFGSLFRLDGSPFLPDCTRPFNQRRIVFPVLMVDFEDYDPATDLANPNNPASRMDGYTRATPAELEAHLNGPAGPAAYYRAISGGKVDLVFEVIGWLRSDTPGSYLKPRSAYLTLSSGDGRYTCDANALTRDALRDALVGAGKDFRRYDSEQGSGLNATGFLDGFALVYEGGPSPCNGTNMSWVYGTSGRTLATFSNGQDDTAWGYERLEQLIDSSDPNHARLSNQQLYYGPYINVPERGYAADGSGGVRVDFASAYAWNHELGHLFLGFPDHYATQHNAKNWLLSGGGHSDLPHPAAWEKWFYGRWLEPVDLNTSGTYTLKANEIADGGRYDAGTYLYRIPLPDSPHHYLTIENRWLRDAGNTATRWAAEGMVRSGLLIMEFDWREQWISDRQLRRQPTAREHDAHYEFGHVQGDVFNKCWGDTCVRITPTTAAGQDIQFSLAILKTSADDRDGDGVPNDRDAFPDNPAEWLDTDQDGTGNNADTDDDNDGVPDTQDAYPLDPTRSKTDAPASGGGGGGSGGVLILGGLLALAAGRRQRQR